MPRKSIRAAVGTYLQKGVTLQVINDLSSVFPYPPKFTDERDFYTAQIPGFGHGAVLFIYIGPTEEERIAKGGQHSGLKFRPYQFVFLCYHRSTSLKAEDAGAQNDDFLDSLVAWIQADRNMGTVSNATGYVPNGAIFQAGEGGISGGTDLRVHSLLPKTNKTGGTLTTFTQIELTVCEILRT